MKSKQQEKTQVIAAAQAGFSERSAKRVENCEFQLIKKQRNWKTRSNPFESVWQSELVPLLEAEPKLEARALLQELQKRYEGEYPDRLLRTLQRRVKQ